MKTILQNFLWYAPGEEASGMAIDLKNHRLFLGCGNKLMVMCGPVT